jgi:pyruvate,water dikinase
MLPLDACAGRFEAGTKAETLARLRRQGLRALDGEVLLAGEAVEEGALAAALARLAGGQVEARFAVRSSSTLEDRLGRSAAGVFESVIGAVGLEGVKAAIARVRASAMAEPARAYLAGRVAEAGVTPTMAVLIQPVVDAERLGVARSIDVGHAGGFLVEERAAAEPEWADVEASRLPADATGALGDGLRSIARLLGGPGIDVEFARRGREIIFLQARPMVPPPAPSLGLGAFRVPGSWRLDAEHNPDPLSSAQAGLVALVDPGARAQRVLDGHLYLTRDAPRVPPAVGLEALAGWFYHQVVPECEAWLRAADGGPLEDALTAYERVYRRYAGEVSPSLRAIRAALDRFLRDQLGEPLGRHGALFAGSAGITLERDQALYELGRTPLAAATTALTGYLSRFGAYAPAWDVAVPPDDEAPERVLACAHRLAALSTSPRAYHGQALATADAAADRLLRRLPARARAEGAALVSACRTVWPIAEDDDLVFFGAQRVVRRALNRLSEVLVRAGALDHPQAIFDVPLDQARRVAAAIQGSAAERVGLDAGERAALREAARVGAARRIAATRRWPPRFIDDGEPRPSAPAGEVLRGQPTSGRARGRALVLRSPAEAPPALPFGSVLVLPAILPSLTYLLPGATALVTEHGGATSHGATLAREYGVPAVLGARGASAIEEGAVLWVDGDAGRVFRL